jgi:hypothetical protein
MKRQSIRLREREKKKGQTIKSRLGVVVSSLVWRVCRLAREREIYNSLALFDSKKFAFSILISLTESTYIALCPATATHYSPHPDCHKVVGGLDVVTTRVHTSRPRRLYRR